MHKFLGLVSTIEFLKEFGDFNRVMYFTAGEVKYGGNSPNA